MGLPPIEPPDLRNRRNRPEDDDDNGDEEQQNYPPSDNYRSPPRPRPQQPQRPQQPYDRGEYPPRDQQPYPPPQQQQDYYGGSEEYTRPHTPPPQDDYYPQQQGQYPPPQRPRQGGREQYPPPDPYGQEQYPPPDPYGQDAYRQREQRYDEQRSRPRGQRSSDLGGISTPDLRRRSESSRREGREQDRLGDIDGGLDLRSRSRSAGGRSDTPREPGRGGSTGGGGGSTSPGSILLGNNFVSEHQIEAFSLGLVFLMLGVGVLMLIFGLGWFLTQVFPLLSGIILLSTGVYQRIIRGWPVSFFTWFFGAILTAIGLTTLFSDQIEDFGIINAMIAFCGISIIMVAMITLVQVFRRG